MKYAFLILLFFTSLLFVNAQTPYLVKDINVGSADAFTTSTNFVCLDGKMIFAPISDTYGRELWITDGTEAGTHLIKDINPGIGDGLRIGHELFVYNNGVLFPAEDGQSGTELWFTDGTEVGTYMVKDINVGSSHSMLKPSFFLYDGNVYFAASTNGGSTQKNLWVTDGTDAGTILVKNIDINSNAGPGYIIMNNEFYFNARASDGYELWKSDGTDAGTIQVKDMNPGSSNGLSNTGFKTKVIFNNELYFWATDGVHGRELWKTDGTELGTTMIKDINPAGDNGFLNSTILKMNNKLYFWANDNINGVELWETDGSELGTQLFKDMNPNGDGTPIGGSLYFFDGLIYFVGSSNNGSKGELWKTDGSLAGTLLVKDIAIDPGDRIGRVFVFLNELYFTFQNANGVSDLWKSDGSTSGTKLVKGFTSGNGINLPNEIYQVNNKIYFNANDGVHGVELWESDGTTNGTILAIDATPGSNGGAARDFMGFCNHLYYKYTNPSTGSELWAINVGNILEIEEISELIDIQFYPNPVDQVLHIKADQPIKTKIMSLEGKLIMESFEKTITTEDLSPGIYIIQFFDENQTQLKSNKLIKI